MNTLSIVLVFLFLAALVVLGSVLVGFGVRRLQHEMQGGAAVSSRTLHISMDVLVAAFGLLLALSGVLSTFRIIWGS